MFSSHTHSLPITTGSGQTTTPYRSIYLYIRILPNCQIWPTQISPDEYSYSYNSLYRPELSGQSYTSPILRWTGNSPIWGHYYRTNYGFIYVWLPHTPDCSARLTNHIYHSKFSKLPRTYVPPQSLLGKDRTIDRMVDRYIVLKTSRKIYYNTRQIYSNTRQSSQTHTCDRKILDGSTPKIDQNAKLNLYINHSK